MATKKRSSGKGEERGKVILTAALALVCVLASLLGIYLRGGNPFEEIFSFFKDSPGILESGEYKEDRLSVFFLDVGQADSILLRSPEGKFMLIDAAKNDGAPALLRTLKEFGVKELEYLVLTHPHEDHIGGADAVLEQFAVKTVLSPDVGSTSKSWRDVLDAIEKEGCKDLIARPGDTYGFFEGCTFTVLGPYDTDEDLNNCSVVFRLDYGETSFLFTGDAEEREELSILENGGSSFLKADVLKVGHHGSSTSTCEEFLSAVSPRCAVISCGENNEYGHPHRSTLDALEDRGIEILRTDLSGTVMVQSDGKNLTVSKTRSSDAAMSGASGAMKTSAAANRERFFQRIFLESVGFRRKLLSETFLKSA